MWTNPFAYAGRRTTGNRAQRLFVHGPDWQGALPEGDVCIAAPGNDVWVIGRMLVTADGVSDADLVEAHRLQDAYAIRRAGAATFSAWQRFDTGMDGRATEVPDTALYRRIVSEVLRRNPAPPEQSSMSVLLDRFGLCKGEAVADQVLAQALADTCAELRQKVDASNIGAGWTLPVSIRTDYGSDFTKRARIARNLIGALGIEEAMYPVCEVDAEFSPLDGRNRYELHFAPGAMPQVDAFWSLTAYRRRDCLLIANPLERYSVGDRSRGLRWDADGSLRIRLQSDDPGEGHNWLPTPHDDQFYLTLRLYQPLAVHLSMQFSYPPVCRIA